MREAVGNLQPVANPRGRISDHLPDSGRSAGDYRRARGTPTRRLSRPVGVDLFLAHSSLETRVERWKLSVERSPCLPLLLSTTQYAPPKHAVLLAVTVNRR